MKARASPIITWGNIQLNPASHGFSVDGTRLFYRQRVCRASCPYGKSGQRSSRQKLEEKIYGWNEEIESNTIEYHMSQLRKKIGRDIIRNIRGVGYTLEKRYDIHPPPFVAIVAGWIDGLHSYYDWLCVF